VIAVYTAATQPVFSFLDHIIDNIFNMSFFVSDPRRQSFGSFCRSVRLFLLALCPTFSSICKAPVAPHGSLHISLFLFRPAHGDIHSIVCVTDQLLVLINLDTV
jgi:hypothetical protein